MADALRRYGSLVVAAVLAGLVGGHGAAWLVTPRAVPGPLLALAEQPFAALLAAFVIVAMLGVIAIATARIVNSAVGLFVLGWGIAVMGMRSGTVVDAAFLANVSPLGIGLETLLWSALVGAVSVLLWRMGGPLEDIRHPHDRYHGLISAVRGWGQVRGLLAAFAAIPIILILMRTTMSGQALGAAACAGLCVGALGRTLAPNAQPIWLAPLAIASVGAAQIVIGGGVVTDQSIVTASVPRLLRAMPIEVAGGLVAGVAMGLGWARSFVTGHGEDGVADDESRGDGAAKPLKSARTA